MTGRWPWGFLRLIMGEITCSLLWARVPSEPTLEHDPRPFGATVKARSEVEEKAARRANLHRQVVGLGWPLGDGDALDLAVVRKRRLEGKSLPPREAAVRNSRQDPCLSTHARARG